MPVHSERSPALMAAFPCDAKKAAADIAAVTARAGVAPEQRPETLDPETFVALARALRDLDRPRHLPAHD